MRPNTAPPKMLGEGSGLGELSRPKTSGGRLEGRQSPAPHQILERGHGSTVDDGYALRHSTRSPLSVVEDGEY